MANIKQIINGDNKLTKSKAVIEFSSDELVILSNALYKYSNSIENPNNRPKNLKDIILIASQISQYGHMDEWAVSTLYHSADNENKEQGK